jgi:hypothetical protein
VTYNGGALIKNVEVEALYYGSDWVNNPTYQSQVGYLEGFLKSLVNSSYMDMLSNAGYGVGRGTFDPGTIRPDILDKTRVPNLEGVLEADINNGYLKPTDANRLYVIFVEDNVRVANRPLPGDSVTNIRGYHYAIPDEFINLNKSIHYVVVAYPGGTIGNQRVPSLSDLDSITTTASREIANAVTDPDRHSILDGAWYDSSWKTSVDPSGSDVGDINPDRVAYVNGYAVQRVVNKDDHLMTPAQATSDRAVRFVRRTNGDFVEVVGTTATTLSGGVAALSDQGIDNHGHAMVDIVQGNGLAYEYHDTVGWTYLGSGVKSAKAGQGVSYVLHTSGDLYEFDDATGTNRYLCGGYSGQVVAIDAGTDVQGLNAVDWIRPSGDAWQYVPSSGQSHFIASGVQSISAGRGGISDYITKGGVGYWYNAASNSASSLGSNVAQVTAGTDASGNAMVDLLFTNGNLYEWRADSSWVNLGGGVVFIGKARAGVVAAVSSAGEARIHGWLGWFDLISGASMAV